MGASASGAPYDAAPARPVDVADFAAALEAEAAFGAAAGAAIAPAARLAWMALLPRWDTGAFAWLLPAGDDKVHRTGNDSEALAYAKDGTPKIVAVLRDQERRVLDACRGVAGVDALVRLGHALRKIADELAAAQSGPELRRAVQRAAMTFDDAVGATVALRDELFVRRADPEYLRAVARALRAMQAASA